MYITIERVQKKLLSCGIQRKIENNIKIKLCQNLQTKM